MLYLDSRVKKIPLPLELDPDFGTEVPKDVDGFVVTVRNTISVYEFILLMPFIDDDYELQELVDNVMCEFLEPNDSFSLRDLNDIDVAIFEKFYLPVLSFHPGSICEPKISFYWQIPPKELMS